jgi:hypothetical protein
MKITFFNKILNGFLYLLVQRNSNFDTLTCCSLLKKKVVSHVILLAKVGKYGVGEMVLNS